MRVFFVKVFLCFWIWSGRSSDGARTEDKRTLAARYAAVRGIANGYDKSNGPLDLGKYGRERIVRMISDEKDRVVCGLSFVALSYMRVSKQLLVWNGQDRLDLAVRQIESFGDHALAMVVVLYNLGYQCPMMGMWYFYIYSRKIAAFLGRIRRYRRRRNDCKVITAELFEIHENVIEKLSMTVKRCEPNRNDIASRHHRLYERYRYLSKSDAGDQEVTAVIEQYKSTVDPLIDGNRKCEYGRRNANRLAIDRLYLNGVVLNRDLMNELQNVYDEKIFWGDAADVLRIAHDDLTDNPGIMFDNLAGIGRFHALFKDFLLTIVLRFTWTHLLVSGHHFDSLVEFYNTMQVERENNEFLAVLVPFLQFLAVDDYPGLTDLFKCMYCRSWLCLKYGTGVALVQKELARIGNNFNDFDPTKGVMCTEYKITENYERLISFSRVHKLRTDYRRKPIKEMTTFKKNYTRLFVFINRVQNLLHHVDFGLMNELTSNTCQTTLDKLKSNMFPPEKIDDAIDDKYIEISIQMAEVTLVEKYLQVSIEMKQIDIEEMPNEKYVEISIAMEDASPIKYFEISIQMQQIPDEKYVEISIQMQQIPDEQYVEISINMEDAPPTKYVEISTQMEDAPPTKYVEISTQMEEFPCEDYAEFSINTEHLSDDDSDEPAIPDIDDQKPQLISSPANYNLVVTHEEPEDGIISWPDHSYNKLFSFPSYFFSPQDYQEKFDFEIEKD